MKKRILFVNLLSSKYGSIVDDKNDILESLNDSVFESDYLDFKSTEFVYAFFRLCFLSITFRYEKIIFLSGKMSHFNVLWPLSLFAELFMIYHFMPAHREGYHKFSLRFLGYFFNIGVYSDGLRFKLLEFLAFPVAKLPFRRINTARSAELLHDKLNADSVNVFIPGIRKGVRRPLHIDTIKRNLENLYKFRLNRITIQNFQKENNDKDTLVRNVGYLDDNDYRCLFLESLFVFMDFEDEYEVRASGVILDAMKYGCIVITSHHAICTEYNFPNSLITDMEGAVSLCQRDNLELDKLEGLIPYSDESVFSRIWQEFLK